MPHRSDAERLIDALQRTGALLAADASLERVMQTVSDAARELTEGDTAAFFYAGEDGEPLRLFTASAAPGLDAGALRRLGRPRCTEVFRATTAGAAVVRSDDITADPRFRGMPRGHFPVRSYLAVPVVSHRRPAGIILVGHAEPGRFRPRDEQVVSSLAAQAAVAIDNARLFAKQRALEDKLLELNERLAERVEARTAERDRLWSLSTDCMSVARSDAVFVAVNPAWERLLGWREDELVGRPFMDFVHPEDVPATEAEAGRLLADGSMPHFENRQRHRDGSFRILSWSAVVDGGYIHSVGRDVTAEREQAEALERVKEQLRQSHKLEAIGVLARGVAHEFANCAAAVLAGLRLLEKKHGHLFADVSSAKAFLQGANEAAARGGATARRLLSFSKRGTLRPEPIALSELLERVRDGLVATAAGGNNAVVVEPPPPGHGDARLVADPAQLAATLIALVMNARDSFPGSGGGTVTFRASAERVNDGKQAGLFGGDYVRIDVEDDGSGMDEMTRSRATEPFFTTHPESDGKGLGLSSALGFAEQSGGSLRIASAPGRGTTVSIWLPREADRPGAAEAPAPAAAESPAP